jgi:beta-alanine--pyruvate transaminase
MTNGTVPMGAVFARDEIYDAFMQGPEGIELFHGYTYSGHPLGCAAGIATLDTYEAEGLLARGASLEMHFEDCLHALKGTRHIVDLRNCGLMGAVELEPRPGRPGARAFEAFMKCFDAGVLVRYTGDTLAFSPPLIIEKAQIERLFDTVRAAVAGVE